MLGFYGTYLGKDEEDDDKIHKEEIYEEKPDQVKKEEEKELKLKAEENRINLKILKLQKEDEEEKAYEEYRNEREEKDGSLSEIEDEADWEWYRPEDQNIYFIVTTSYPYFLSFCRSFKHNSSVKKGQQIYNCYGRRNNRFLLMWYGFALRENAYDSLPLRVVPFYSAC